MTSRFIASLTVVAVAIGFATAAQAEEGFQSFTRDGVTYSYRLTAKESGVKRISGTAVPGGAFTLTVAKGKVSGNFNGNRVAFKVSEATMAADKATEVTMR